MSSETFKALVIEMITSLSKDQLKLVLGNISDSSLEEVGKVLLAEKGRKGNEDKQVDKPVEKRVEESVEVEKAVEKAVEKVVKDKGGDIAKPKVPKKVIHTGRGSPVATVDEETKGGTGSKKRKHGVIDLSQDDLERIEPAESLLRVPGRTYDRYQKIKTAYFTAMTFNIRGADREKMQRLSVIMDDMVDWDRVKSRRDVTSALFQGELEMCCNQSNPGCKPMINCKADMEALVMVNHCRLLNHPMYATIFQDVGERTRLKLLDPSSSIHSTPPQERTISLSTRSNAPQKTKKTLQTSFPTLDWKALAPQTELFDPAQPNPHLVTLINSLCDTFDDITRQCNPVAEDKVDIRVLQQLVEQMYIYAETMSAASPEDLSRKLFGSMVSYKLEECCRAICTAIAKHEQVDVSANLCPAAKKLFRQRLEMVQTLLWTSEIPKVIHHFFR